MTKLINYYNTLSKEEKIYLCEHYSKWVESISPSRPHHVRRLPYCGMSQKPPNIFCVPVTYEEHDAIHKGRIGRDTEDRMLAVVHNEYFELYIEHKLEGI